MNKYLEWATKPRKQENKTPADMESILRRAGFELTAEEPDVDVWELTRPVFGGAKAITVNVDGQNWGLFETGGALRGAVVSGRGAAELERSLIGRGLAESRKHEQIIPNEMQRLLDRFDFVIAPPDQQEGDDVFFVDRQFGEIGVVVNPRTGRFTVIDSQFPGAPLGRGVGPAALERALEENT